MQVRIMEGEHIIFQELALSCFLSSQFAEDFSLEYLSEGAVHVVFACSSDPKNRWFGKVLRVPKATGTGRASTSDVASRLRDLPMYLCQSSRAPFDTLAHSEHEDRPATRPPGLCAVLGDKYAPTPQFVRLELDNSSVLDEAIVTAQRSGKRPKRWAQTHSSALFAFPCVAALWRAADKVPCDYGQTLRSADVFVELKPKAMVLPSVASAAWGGRMGSKLTHPIKATTSRFAMQQVFKLAIGRSAAASAYDPCDLASHVPRRRMRALQALRENAQNNFALHKCTPDIDPIAVLDAVLRQEPVLQMLASLQRASPWEEDAMAALSSVPGMPTLRKRLSQGVSYTLSELIDLGSVAPDLKPTETKALHAWLEENPHALPARIVKSFLVGKAAKDVGVTVAAVKVPARSMNSASLSDSSKLPQTAARNQTCEQGCDAAGRVIVHSAQGVQHFEYLVSVVDLDDKLPENIPYYFHQDALIVQAYLEHMSLLPHKHLLQHLSSLVQTKRPHGDTAKA